MVASTIVKLSVGSVALGSRPSAFTMFASKPYWFWKFGFLAVTFVCTPAAFGREIVLVK